MSKVRRSRQTPKEQAREAVVPAPPSGHYRLAALLAAVACLLYAPTWLHGFAGDDWWVIVTNQWTRQGVSALPDIVSHSLYFGAIPLNGGLYRPFAGLYYVLVGALGGISPMPYHIATTLLYGLNVALLFLFFVRLTGRSVLLPIIATLLFVVHPIHTEVVNNIKSADEMLCLGALLASGLFWLR